MAAQVSAAAVAALTFPELEERRDEIFSRLKEVGADEPSKKKPGAKRPRSDGIPYDTKTDTHWDFLMKEMMWLGADFMGERKRQHGLAKKQANGINQFHKTKETRRVRLLAEAELKRRRLSSKIGREVRGWWTKIERVIAYKQKISADQERRKAMNQQLVELVRLTERYGETVVTQSEAEDGPASLTIEEALSAADRLRHKEPRDYARLELDENRFYGESTTEESGSDGSFVLDSEEDDETTLKEAEVEETRARRPKSSDVDDNGDSYVADPDEMRKLQEESNMKIDDVLHRLREEGENGGDATTEVIVEEEEDPDAKRVTFAKGVKNLGARNKPRRSRSPAPRNRLASSQTDPGFEADDDGDASDVEDFVDNDTAQISDGSEEFQADENEADDETTMAAEERLGRDMSPEDEIDLLQQEGEMSIEELRKMYAAMEEGTEEDDEDASNEKYDEDALIEADSKLPAQDSAQASAKFADAEKMFEEDDAGEEDEFQPLHEVDDETTMEAEEILGRDMSYEDEIALLNQESQMSVEELRKLYGGVEGENGNDDEDDVDEIDMLSNEYDGDDGEDEFTPVGEAVDDETTLDAEERLGREMSAENEIALLKRESETPIEELRAIYNNVENANELPSGKINGSHTIANDRKRRRLDKEEGDDEDGMEALKNLRESEDRARATLATRPFLLSSWVKLRKYQQTGLNWLVSTQTRRLNGIL